MNTHNYLDWPDLDPKVRMTQISSHQKYLTTKYRCCMLATAEYRKNMPLDISKLKLPVDDDLADARALQYRPQIIFHVYNDMNDRKEHAEIFWTDKSGQAQPRLLLSFTKNKISSFKDKLILDLDPSNVMLVPVDADRAYKEGLQYREAKEAGTARLEGTRVVYVDATEYEESK